MSQTVGYSLGTRGIFISDLLPMQKGILSGGVQGCDLFLLMPGLVKAEGMYWIGVVPKRGLQSHPRQGSGAAVTQRKHRSVQTNGVLSSAVYYPVHYRVGMTAKGSAEKDFWSTI